MLNEKKVKQRTQTLEQQQHGAAKSVPTAVSAPPASQHRQQASSLLISSRRLQQTTSKQHEEFLTKTRFGTELAQKFARVDKSVFVDSDAAAAVHPATSASSSSLPSSSKKAPQEQQQQQQQPCAPVVACPTPDGGISRGNSSSTNLYKNQFISRNAKAAAVASGGANDPVKGAERKPQAQLQPQHQVSPPLPTATSAALPLSGLPLASSSSTTPSLPVPPMTTSTPNSSTKPFTETPFNQPQQPQKQQRHWQRQHHDVPLAPQLHDLPEEEKLARMERRLAADHRERAMSEHPLTDDDLQLHSSSGWVQRAMERKGLEDDDDVFQYRMKLKERDDKKRAATSQSGDPIQSPVERYRRGLSFTSSSFSSPSSSSSPGRQAATGSNKTHTGSTPNLSWKEKLPGSDTALQVGVGALFKPPSLIPEMMRTTQKHVASTSPSTSSSTMPAEPTSAAAPANTTTITTTRNNNNNKSDDPTALSAVDDRRHRQQLVRFNTLLSERERLATEAGVELFQTSSKLMSKDFEFLGDSSVPSNNYNANNNNTATSSVLNKKNISRSAESSDSSDDDDDGDDDACSSARSSSISHENDDDDDDGGGYTRSRSSPAAKTRGGLGSGHLRHRQHIANVHSQQQKQQQRNQHSATPHEGQNRRGRSGRRRSHHTSTPSTFASKKLRDVIDLLESATVSSCELIMANNASSGALSSEAIDDDHQHKRTRQAPSQTRQTDATVIKNILKRALVILVPTVRTTIEKAKRENASNTASKVSAAYYQPEGGDMQRRQAELKKQQHRLALLRSWLKGCEVWIASELGLDSHAGFFSVADKVHLREFASLYARTKQVAERNAEVLMRRWQRERDIMTADPASLVSLSSNGSFDAECGPQQSQHQQQQAKYFSPSPTLGSEAPSSSSFASSSSITATLPAELSNFFRIIKIGNTNTAMMRQLFAAPNSTSSSQLSSSTAPTKATSAMSSDAAAVIGSEAKEATGRYFETLEKFGIIATNGVAPHHEHPQVPPSTTPNTNTTNSSSASGSTLRLKQMLRKFAGIDEDDLRSYQQQQHQQRRPRRPSTHSSAHRDHDDDDDENNDAFNITTTMANLFQPSLMRSVMMDMNNAGDAATGAVSMTTPSSEVASRVAATEAHDTVGVLELFMALLGESTRNYVREEIDDMMKYFHDTSPDRAGDKKWMKDSQVSLEDYFSTSSTSSTSASKHVTGQARRQELLREKQALQSVHAQLLHLKAEESTIDHQRIAQLRRAIDKTDSWVHISEDNTGVTAKHLALVQQSKIISNNGSTNNNNNNYTNSNNTDNNQNETLTAAEGEESSSNSIEMRSAAEEKARALSLQKLAQAWKQLFVPFQYRMELLDKYRNAPAAKVHVAEQRFSECVAAVATREALVSTIVGWGSKIAADEAAANLKLQEQESVHNKTIAGASWRSERQQQQQQQQQQRSSSSPATDNLFFFQDAEAKRQRQQKKQQLLSDLAGATGACDVAIEKLAAIGEQLYYHSVLYSVKMKDDFASVTKILRTSGGGGGKDF